MIIVRFARRHLHNAGLVLLSIVAAATTVPALGQGVIPGITRPPVPVTDTRTGAHARYSKAQINLEPADLQLTVAVINAGGGPTAFATHRLIAALAGEGSPMPNEMAALSKKFSADDIALFERTSDFVVQDALSQSAIGGISLPVRPDPNLSGFKILASTLYAAGLTPGRRFDVEFMLDSLVSHIIHVQTMNDIDANPALGPKADANYHAVLTQFMLDVKSAYALSNDRGASLVGQ